MADEGKGKTGFFKGCLMLIGAVVVVLIGITVIGLVAGDKHAGKAPGAEQSAAAPQVVSARELSAAFQANEARAKLTYDGHPVEVTGTIKDIDLNIVDSPVIHLRGSGDVADMGVNEHGKMTDVDVAGLSKEQAAKLDKGSKLTVICQSVDEVMGSPQLADCVVK
jgi:hypothetical protein